MDKIIFKECEMCHKMMELKINTKEKSKNYGKIIKIHENKRFCSKECQIKWQKTVNWEDRVGNDTADKIRFQTSERVKGDKNPSKNKDVAKKISNSLIKYLEHNPRIAEKNGMYDKSHTDEYKKWASESRKGMRSYDDIGYNKLLENTPKGDEHHNWLGGISKNPYPFEFDDKLKRKIKERDDHKCSICDKKTQKLPIHHIDYDKNNNNEKNLISLCVKCHGITNYNREQWKLFFGNKIDEMYKIKLN